MIWHRHSARQLRLFTRNIRTQPLYEHPHGEEHDVPSKQPPGFGLATPREVGANLLCVRLPSIRGSPAGGILERIYCRTREREESPFGCVRPTLLFTDTTLKCFPKCFQSLQPSAGQYLLLGCSGSGERYGYRG